MNQSQIVLLALGINIFVIYMLFSLYSPSPCQKSSPYGRRDERPIIHPKSIPAISFVPGDRSRMQIRNEISHVDCARLFSGDTSYAKQIAGNGKRPALVSTSAESLDMSCEAIKRRILPARNADTGYPIAYVKNVYMDYEFLEEQLAITYAAENSYCFNVDFKSEPRLHERIGILSGCLPNVILADEIYQVEPSGTNQTYAQIACLKKLRHRAWNYAIMLQNNDIMIKTHAELTTIFMILNGANEVEVTPCPEDRCRVNFVTPLQSNLGSLGLCPRNTVKGVDCSKKNISWAKGAMQVSMSRAAIDYIFDAIDVQPFLADLHKVGFGNDEIFWSTLQVTEAIGLPGGYSSKCTRAENMFLTRYSDWTGNCPSGKVRHYICVMGVEDLPRIHHQNWFMVNKMLPEFDYAAISCVGQLLENRTRGIDNYTIHTQFYKNLKQVQFNRDHASPNFRLENFTC